jgi:hypothetical protein
MILQNYALSFSCIFKNTNRALHPCYIKESIRQLFHICDNIIHRLVVIENKLNALRTIRIYPAISNKLR